MSIEEVGIFAMKMGFAINILGVVIWLVSALIITAWRMIQ